MATKQEIKERQCLLFYLGYYVGDVDGIWGQMSKTAVKAFKGDFGGFAVNDTVDEDTLKAMTHAVAYGMPAKKEEIPEESPEESTTETSGTFWDGIKYFDRSEFKCTCNGRGCNGFPVEPDENLVRVADRIRAQKNSPATVSSGVRCKLRNSELPGSVSNSRHLSGKAMDFSVRGVSGSELLALAQSQPEIRYAYIIEGGWVHMDVE